MGAGGGGHVVILVCGVTIVVYDIIVIGVLGRILGLGYHRVGLITLIEQGS